MRRFIGQLRNKGLRGYPAPEQYGHFQVLWRGYIANRAELVAEAKRRGVVLESCSDGALFAQAYQWWETELQRRVLGEYAVAVFDRRNSSLLLTHDALGLVPLFYATLPEGLLFGAHLEDMVLKTGVGELDEEYIADYLANSSCGGEHTPYRRIRRLGPGRTLLWRGERLVTRRTWELAEVQPMVLADDREYEERLRDLVGTGVRAALRSSGPVWSECSGGLDSSTVACAAAQSGAKHLAAISIVFSRSRKADERQWTQAVLDKYPMPWHQVDGDDSLPYSELPNRFCAEPNLATIHWSWHRRYEAVLGAHGVEALLTGQGGDHIFLGAASEPYYLADRAFPWRPHRLLAELGRWQQADRSKRSLLYWLTNFVVRPTVRHALGRPLRRVDHPGLSPWICPEYARAMRLKGRPRQREVSRFHTAGEQWFGENLASVCGLIANLNQTPANFEYRHPLLYRPLVEFIHAIPWEKKLQPASDRYLQRRAFKGILPEKVRSRQDKTTFDQPSYEGLRQGRSWLDILTKDPRIVARGIVNGKRWGEAVAQARMGRTFFLPQFDAAATLEVWLRQVEEATQFGTAPVPVWGDEVQVVC